SPKKKAAPAKRSGKPALGGRGSETEQKAAVGRAGRVFRGASETEGKGGAGREKGRRAPTRGVSETEQKAVKKKSVTVERPIKKKVVRDSRGRVRDYKKEY